MVRCCFPGWLLQRIQRARGRDPDAPRPPGRARERSVDSRRNADPRDDGRGPRVRRAHRRDQADPPHRFLLLDARDDGAARRALRDEMLSCIQRLETFDKDTVVAANELPNTACLVARGSIGLYDGGKLDKLVSVVEPDSFYGVRDAIHRIAPSVSAIARSGTTIAFFDAARLRSSASAARACADRRPRAPGLAGAALCRRTSSRRCAEVNRAAPNSHRRTREPWRTQATRQARAAVSPAG